MEGPELANVASSNPSSAGRVDLAQETDNGEDRAKASTVEGAHSLGHTASQSPASLTLTHSSVSSLPSGAAAVPSSNNLHKPNICNRDRIVSLDRREHIIRIDDSDAHSGDYSSTSESSHEASHASRRLEYRRSTATSLPSLHLTIPPRRTSREEQSSSEDDASDSSNTSDEESSYFSENLPDPKSMVRSTSQLTPRNNPLPPGYASKKVSTQSDASLSFSSGDDDEDGESPPAEEDVQLELHTRRTTRLHSVSSLVSSSSSDQNDTTHCWQDEADDYDRKSANTTGLSDDDDLSHESIASELSCASSDPSVRSELLAFGAPGSTDPLPVKSGGGNRSSSRPSGRQVPTRDLAKDSPTNSAADEKDTSRMFNDRDIREGTVKGGEVFARMFGGLSPAVLPSPVYPSAETPSGVMYPTPHRPQEGADVWTKHNEISRAGGRNSFGKRSSDAAFSMQYSEDDETDESLKWKGNELGGSDGSMRTFNTSAASASIAESATRSNAPGKKSSSFAPSSRTSGGNMRPAGSDGASLVDRSITNIAPSELKHFSRRCDKSEATSKELVNPVEGGFTVYWQRWVMLGYMSVLNLLSDWTCYSVAPISVLTSEAFGSINPESLVTIFLIANAIATALEPVILGRLGLRRTIFCGALLLMIGSIVKSGGIPLIIGTTLQKGQGEWRVYLGFFLVGLSQPLYQCTPALLSASWFPEKERTLATGVALNSNQLGIGCAFVFGTLLVATSDDIPGYFGLLSFISTLAFIGCAIQFDDAPPTPPSDTARVMRGTLEVKIPSMENFRNMLQSMSTRVSSNRSNRRAEKYSGNSVRSDRCSQEFGQKEKEAKMEKRHSVGSNTSHRSSSSRRSDEGNLSRRSGILRQDRSSLNQKSSSTSNQVAKYKPLSSRQQHKFRPSGDVRNKKHQLGETRSATSENGFRIGSRDSRIPGPSAVSGNGPTEDYVAEISAMDQAANAYGSFFPSPMMSGRVGREDQRDGNRVSLHSASSRSQQSRSQASQANSDYLGQGFTPQQTRRQINNLHGYGSGMTHETTSTRDYLEGDDFQPTTPFANLENSTDEQVYLPYSDGDALGPWYPTTTDPRFYYQNSNIVIPTAMSAAEYQFYQQRAMRAHYHSGYYDNSLPMLCAPPSSRLPALDDTIDEGAEPILMLTPNRLDVDIRDDQIILSIRACFSRPGFVHALVAFAVSGIVINTLSTYMDYLVRLGGAGRQYVGIIGGLFQLLIMISSLLIGQKTDKTRAYYSVSICLLVLGAFALAECGVSLDANRGGNLRIALLVVAVLVGPLQPVATELGVDVVFPLSENTVLVIQQLFANLLSALFIPFFKAVRDVGGVAVTDDESDRYGRPQYTFSFYLLIVIHACATAFFATFNGRYLRLAHELKKKEKNEEARDVGMEEQQDYDNYESDRDLPISGSYRQGYALEQANQPGRSERQPLLGLTNVA